MSISFSTNLLLVDASAKAGTIILPNPSTIAGKILYIRDIAGTINSHSTVSLVTETTHISVATMFMPSSFITLVAAPVSSIQYHVIGGNYLEQLGNSGLLTASTISTPYFYTQSAIYSNASPNLSTITTVAANADLHSTSMFIGSNVSFDSNFQIAATGGQLYLNNAPWQGKNFAINTPTSITDETFPYQFMNTNSVSPLYWFDGKDSNTMYTGLTTNVKVSIGQKVVRWNSKPSTLQFFAWNAPEEGCGTFTGDSGVQFPSDGGFIFSNLDPYYANYPYAMPIAASYTMYLVATKRLGAGAGAAYFCRPGYPIFPCIFTNLTATSLYSNGNISTPVTSATSNAAMWYMGYAEFFPFTLNIPDGFNIFTVKKSTAQPNPVLELYFNGSNVYSAYSSGNFDFDYGPAAAGLTVLGDYNAAHIGPSAKYGDWLMYSDIIHTRSQQQQMEGYLATKWGIRNKLPFTHPYYKAPDYIPINP